ncbi:serine/threonine protein kinase [Paraliomyxa miuraensis]|uniref:serine/threonine protein kinase n=1 Tax=Paraliomyxa miuraensis TaxID=376150 RepID=UPI00225A73FD|nr:serine/threonine protein kinase [Paraliomyxa miuraensis]MCX4246594.1 protein kinase [Paraliomyxa miuraensis]
MPEAVALPEPNLVGQMLDGRYQVMQRLGEGELTCVYEARHTGSGRHFAIKVLRAPLAAKPNVLDRFLQQARAAAQIRHDNVVTIEEFGYTPTQSVYASVELVVADTLQKILDRDGRWPWAQARAVAAQIAAGLSAAHANGMVHGSLRPANCFVVLDPRGKRDPFVKVADFGMAQVGVAAQQASPDSTTAGMFGDPLYMSPEQGFGGQVTPQSDIYAFGVVLYHFLLGQVPFASGNPFQIISQHAQKPVPPLRDVDPSIPEAVEQLVMRCLGKTPDQRFGSAAQLEQAIAAIPAHAQGTGPAPSPSASNPRFARMSSGNSSGPAAPPPKQPSVIVAGSIGDGGGGISGTIGESEPAPYDPYGGSIGGAAPAAPAYAGSSATSSFLASRPGLRMGLGAAVSNDGPAPPPTIAPGMAVPSPTIAPGSMSSPFTGMGPDSHSPYSPPPEAGPGMPPLGMGPGMPPAGAGPGYPPAGGAGMPPGYPPAGAGPGYPPVGAGPGYPPVGAGPGYPPVGAGPGYPPAGAGPGYPPAGGGLPPLSAGPGIPPAGSSASLPSSNGLPPLGAGPGMPPAGPGYPPVGGGMPPLGSGPGLPPLSAGPGMPPPDDSDLGSGDGIRRGVGPGIPPRVGMAGSAGAGVGAGMPLRGVGPGIPPLGDRPMPGANAPPLTSALPPSPESLGAVEYDQDEEPKRRTLLLVGIGVGVILLGIGLALLIARGLEDPEGDLAKVTRTQKAQDVQLDPEEPEQPKPEEPDDPDPEPTVVKKVAPKKTLTFEQSLTSMKDRIRSRCKKLGEGPVKIDTFVDRNGGRANTPKVEPKGQPVGTCALRIVEQWNFPASEEDHPINERVSW